MIFFPPMCNVNVWCKFTLTLSVHLFFCHIRLSQLTKRTVSDYKHFPPPHYPIFLSHHGFFLLSWREMVGESKRGRGSRWRLHRPPLFPSVFTPQIVWKREKWGKTEITPAASHPPPPSPPTLPADIGFSLESFCLLVWSHSTPSWDWVACRLCVCWLVCVC